jgi:hypothetical protein
MFPGSPSQAQIIGGSRTTSGLLATVPAGMTLTANIGMTAAVAVLGTSAPVVTVNGAGAAPAAGTVVARLVVSGLLAAVAAAAEDFEILVKAPPGNDITLDFTAGAAGASSATINGWYFS